MQPSSETKKIDKYNFQLSNVLGQGSFGKVFKGKNTENGQLVAIKMIEKKHIQNDEYLMNGLFQEIQIMKKLKSEFVVDLIDVLETSNNYYIIQEHCDGGDFRSELKKKKNLSEADALNVMKDLLTGFMDLLKNGIIHRDLKPENILIKGNQHKLADFGFARTVDNFQRQMLTSLVGTPLYMSPQILMHEKYTSKSDLWSLAFIFYEMMYGKTPYTANSQYQLVKNIQTKPLEFDPAFNVSDLSKDLIIKCLKIDESQRLDWTDVYKHPVFQGHFQQFTSQFDMMEDKAKYIINELRQTIYKNRIDLENLFKEYDFSHDSKLEMKEFASLMKSIDTTLERSEVEYIFNKFDDDKDNTISFEEFTKWLSNNDVVMSTKIPSNVPRASSIARQNTQNGLNSGNNSPAHQYPQPQLVQKHSGFQMNQLNNPSQSLTASKRDSMERANQAIKKLQFAITKYNINIGELFSKYDKSDDKQLDINEFSRLLKKVDPDLTQEELSCTFTIFDKNNDQNITFNEFFQTLQEISLISLQMQRQQQQQLQAQQQYMSPNRNPSQQQNAFFPPNSQNGGVVQVVPQNINNSNVNYQGNQNNHH